jgi:hypothetical protein
MSGGSSWPPLFRRAALLILPIAVALAIFIELQATSKGNRHGISGTAIHAAQAAVLVIALLLSSPFIAQLLKRVLTILLLLAGAGWLIFSIALTGGHYHWWPSLVKPGTYILLQNIAFLTCMIGIPLVLYIVFAGLRDLRRKPATGSVRPISDRALGPTQTAPSTRAVEEATNREYEKSSQEQLDRLAWEAEQKDIWGS